MWLKILISYFILMAAQISNGLTGHHVCQQLERYMENVTEYFTRNVTSRSYQWCLQVPPRCSVFSIKLINDSRIIEKERIRAVDACCKGFIFDASSETCIQDCGNCVHGKCNDENKCYCDPGYRGDNCTKGCEPVRWGRYCRYHCMCNRGICNPQTGICLCPPGWTGMRCELQCQIGYFGEQCEIPCNCEKNEICHHVDGSCSKTEIITQIPELITSRYSKKIIKIEPSLKKYHTFDIRTLKQETKNIIGVENKKVDIYYLTTTELSTTILPEDRNISGDSSTTPQNYAIIADNTKVGINLLTTNIFPKTTTELVDLITTTETDEIRLNKSENILLNLSTLPSQDILHTNVTDLSKIELIRKVSEGELPIPEIETTKPSYVSSYEDVKSERGPADVNIKTGDQPVHIRITKSDTLKGKVVSEVSGTRITLLPEETWFNDDSQLEVIHRDPSATNDGLMFSTTTTTTAVATLFLLVTCLYLVLVRIKKRAITDDTQCNDNSNAVMSTVVTTRSIFHTPLPDPPLFENNICSPAIEHNQTTIETQIIYSMNVCTPHKYTENNDAELFYDHPPSTGSYRAASVPELPDYKLLQTSEINMDPIYDEIPCWTQPVILEEDCDTLYMNTLNENKTRF